MWFAMHVVRSLSWNSYHSADLLTADYDGSLSLYDAATGQRIKMFQVSNGSDLGDFPLHMC